MHRTLLAILLCSAAIARGENVQEILQATGIKGGLIVHVGCGDGKLTTALRANDSFIVHGLDTVLTLYGAANRNQGEVVRQYSKVREVLARPEELVQVWTNLVKNAMQAMDHGGY